ncbi:hypothetical protein Bca52824_059124 [Brassica carinata]|uniref:Uncharacterized protein n=1 Tax=Brassica carinata TaxID=52824 RepID=A0A8X7UFD3_BRACI|nr:hypothetical protein Bca52824_059124 [Brassica carinata]
MEAHLSFRYVELDFNGINVSVEISVINRASAIDVKETVNDDMCVLISSFNYQCLHFGLNHEFAVTARALVLFFVICAGVQENGKLPTENEPKIGLSLQNVRTVKTVLTTQFHIPYIDDNDTNFSPQT